MEKIEKSLFELKSYHDYDDIEYKAIRDVKNVFNLSIDEDYYKPIKTNDALIAIKLNIKAKEIRTKLCHQNDQIIFKRYSK